MTRLVDISWSRVTDACRLRLVGRRLTYAWSTELPWRRWTVHASMVGAVLFMACGWVGGSPAPTPTPLPPVPSPSPSPAGVRIPPAAIVPSPSPSPSPSPGSLAGGESYTVSEGDTLATIAARFYGDENQWRRIYDANRQTIGDNPDNLRIGSVLRIPPRQ